MKANYSVGFFAGAALFFALSATQMRAQTELINNGGFESGNANWVMSGGAGSYDQYGYAHSGIGYLWLGGVANEMDAAYQTITIPSGATSATLSYYYNIFSSEGTSFPFDTFQATIRSPSGTVLATVDSRSNVDQDPDAGNPYYHLQTFNLLAYAGQTIRVYFGSTNDSSLETSFLIDDVSVQVSSSTAPPSNDPCSGAIAMTAGTTYTVNTTYATSTGDPTPVCQGSFGRGVWYTYTPASSGTVTISTCGSDFDTVVAVYSGSCGSLTPVACNDNSGPSCATSRASVSFFGVSGTTYFILAGGAAAASGNLSIVAFSGGLIII